MDTKIEIMVFLLAAIILIPSLFDRVRNWKHYKKLIIAVLLLYISAGIWWIILKKSSTETDRKEITNNTDSNSTSIKSQIDTNTQKINYNTDSNSNAIMKSVSQNKSIHPNPTIKQENKKGDNNSIGRDNKGVQGKNNSNNHIINGTNNGINGDVNIGNMPKVPDQSTLMQIEDSIEDKTTQIYLIESTTNSANRTYCEKLKILLNANGYSNIHLESITVTRMGTCPEPGIHILRNSDSYTICVSEE